MTRASTSYTGAGATTAALYKAWTVPISSMLGGLLTRTADTGQVVWANVTTEPTTIRDYEVYALGGSLQATAPIFFRFDYVGGATAGATNGVRVTVGTSTDGAGNITGAATPAQQLTSFAPSNLQRNAYVSVGDSYLTFAYNIDPASTTADGLGLFVFERTRSVDGTPNGDGYTSYSWKGTGAATNVWQGAYNRIVGAATQPALNYDPQMIVPNLANNASYFAGTVSQAFPAYGYGLTSPAGASRALLAGFPGDFPRLTEIAVSHYGATYQFLSLSGLTTIPVPYMSAAATASKKDFAPLIRWE